jgi:hypothetical protein
MRTEKVSTHRTTLQAALAADELRRVVETEPTGVNATWNGIFIPDWAAGVRAVGLDVLLTEGSTATVVVTPERALYEAVAYELRRLGHDGVCMAVEASLELASDGPADGTQSTRVRMWIDPRESRKPVGPAVLVPVPAVDLQHAWMDQEGLTMQMLAADIAGKWSA